MKVVYQVQDSGFMNSRQQGQLRFLALLFLLPGLPDLIGSAVVSTCYLQTLPQRPIPIEMRMTPRNIHGTVVYKTEEEDRRLTVIEDTSMCVFLVGLGLSLVYLRKWGIAQTINADAEEDEYQSESP